MFKEVLEGNKGDVEVTEDIFEEVLNKLEKENERTYDFLTKSSNSF